MARRFQFRLETVRRLRARARDEQRRVVADVVQSAARVEARIAGLNDELRESVDLARDERQTDHLNVPALRGQLFYRGLLHRRILEAQIDLGGEQQRLTEQRAKLAEVSAQLKAIEKLRERRWRRHLVTLTREEQFQTDDIHSAAYIRDMGGGEDGAA